MKNVVKIQEVRPSQNSRRSFLKISGLGAVTAGLVLTGCSDDDDTTTTPTPVQNDSFPGVKNNGIFDLGGGDLGVLTYAYALEQLEADFYTRVVNASNFGSGSLSTEERNVLIDIYYHEVIHRQFFKAAIQGALAANGLDESRLLPDLSFAYASVDFTNREQVLMTAKALEDTGVAAYNGAGFIITDPTYLTIAGKIVSVEARHASAIRTLLNNNNPDPDYKSFAGDDVVDPDTGLDVQAPPSAIIPQVVALNFIQTQFTANNLP